MASKKYPLDPLLKVREKEAERATRALADAVRAREDAERAKRAAEEAKQRAEDEARAIREAEDAKLAGGELKVADLMRGDAWAAGVATEHERLDAQVATAARSLDEARTGEGRAKADMTSRKADVDVVEKDRGKWQDRGRREADARDEQEAAEAWRPKRG